MEILRFWLAKRGLSHGGDRNWKDPHKAKEWLTLMLISFRYGILYKIYYETMLRYFALLHFSSVLEEN